MGVPGKVSSGHLRNFLRDLKGNIGGVDELDIEWNVEEYVFL